VKEAIKTVLKESKVYTQTTGNMFTHLLGVDLLSPLRDGADDETLKKFFLEAIRRREPYYKE